MTRSSQRCGNVQHQHCRCRDKQKCWKWEGAWQEARDQGGERRRGGQRAEAQGYVQAWARSLHFILDVRGSHQMILRGRAQSDLHFLKFSTCKFTLWVCTNSQNKEPMELPVWLCLTAWAAWTRRGHTWPIRQSFQGLLCKAPVAAVSLPTHLVSMFFGLISHLPVALHVIQANLHHFI